MTTTTFTRGSTLVFESTFYDEDGEIIEPATANLFVLDNKGATIGGPYGLTPASGDVWEYALETNELRAGVLYWCIKAEGGGRSVAEEGKVTLEAGPANQAGS